MTFKFCVLVVKLISERQFFFFQLAEIFVNTEVRERTYTLFLN